MSSDFIVMYCHGLMYKRDDVKVGHYCIVMVDRNNQIDKIQSGPLVEFIFIPSFCLINHDFIHQTFHFTLYFIIFLIQIDMKGTFSIV